MPASHLLLRAIPATLFALALIAPAGAAETDKAQAPGAAPAPGADLAAFTGRHTRVVWIQDAGAAACINAERPTMRLMGIDSGDGAGERAILAGPASFYKPLLTADGAQVVYTDHETHTVCVVPFAGGTPRVVVRDAIGEDVWTDPADGVTWVYAKVGLEGGAGEPYAVDLSRAGRLLRYRLDRPEVSELVWDKTPFGHFQLSGDGLAASGSGLNGQGIFRLPNVSFTATENGCWPSMAPDDSHHFWVFNGHHRGIHFFTPQANGSDIARWQFDIANAPGIPGNAETLHPRWSNHPQFLVLTGPYASFQWADAAKITPEVAAGVEIHLGRMGDDYHGMAGWVQVTHNQRGDYWPDAWIEPEVVLKPVAAVPAAPAPAPAKPTDAAFADPALQFLFSDAAGSNQTSQDGGRHIRICGVTLAGTARFARHGLIEPAGGLALLRDAPAVLDACRAADAITLSCTIHPAAEQSAAAAVVVAIGGPGRADLALSQSGGRLLLRGSDGSAADLGEVGTQPQHLLLSLAGGSLSVYRDGRLVLPAPVTATPSGPRGWHAQAIALGAAVDGAQPWRGTLCDIALRSRATPAAEAAAIAAAALARAATRLPATCTVVDGVLVARTPAADPRAIAPYTRCLSLSTWDVTTVVDGRLEAKRIAVYTWSVLGARPVADYAATAVGGTRRLTLEAFDDHPELEAERQTSAVAGADALPLYYATGTSAISR